jgi:hypothetical protein
MVISCRVISGFGNNLYQIATAYSIAMSVDEDYEMIAPKSDGDFQEIRDFGGHFVQVPEGLPKTVPELFPQVNWVKSKGVNNSLISSYIFDYNVMENYIKEIKELLTPVDSVCDYIDSKYGSFDIGIHLRYKNESDSFAPEVNNEGWLRSIMDEEIKPGSNVAITNSNPVLTELTVAEWRKVYPEVTFTVIKDEPMYIDMFILSRCKVLVCGNSTLSFWSGILGEDKKVYMSPYYLGHTGCKNTLPPHWITNKQVFDEFNV